MKRLPVEMQIIDSETGEVTEQSAANFALLPPPKDACQVCGYKHELLDPHNVQSLYYQYAFYGVLGRWPTWADAVAHCDEQKAVLWEKALRERRAWSEPPAGHRPVTDLGSEPA